MTPDGMTHFTGAVYNKLCRNVYIGAFQKGGGGQATINHDTARPDFMRSSTVTNAVSVATITLIE